MWKTWSEFLSQGPGMTLSKRTDGIAAIIGMAWAVAALAIDKTSPHRFPEEAVVSAIDLGVVVAQCLVLLVMALGHRLAFKIWMGWCAWLLLAAIVGLLAQSNWYPPPIGGIILDAALSALFLVYCIVRLKTTSVHTISRHNA